jgi:hypothetical protein
LRSPRGSVYCGARPGWAAPRWHVVAPASLACGLVASVRWWCGFPTRLLALRERRRALTHRCLVVVSLGHRRATLLVFSWRLFEGGLLRSALLMSPSTDARSSNNGFTSKGHAPPVVFFTGRIGKTGLHLPHGTSCHPRVAEL